MGKNYYYPLPYSRRLVAIGRICARSPASQNHYRTNIERAGIDRTTPNRSTRRCLVSFEPILYFSAGIGSCLDAMARRELDQLQMPDLLVKQRLLDP